MREQVEETTSYYCNAICYHTVDLDVNWDFIGGAIVGTSIRNDHPGQIAAPIPWSARQASLSGIVSK